MQLPQDLGQGAYRSWHRSRRKPERGSPCNLFGVSFPPQRTTAERESLSRPARAAEHPQPPTQGPEKADLSVRHARHHTRLVAYAAHPERFVNGPPRREKLSTAVWINPPENTTLQDAPGSIQTDEVDLRVDPACTTCEPHVGTRPGGLIPVNTVGSLQ
jgi:hypothetical protein